VEPDPCPLEIMLTLTIAGAFVLLTTSTAFALQSTRAVLPPPFSLSITEHDIAGRALAGVPHFEFVAAIQQTELLFGAIDPTLYPETVGVAAKIWVVADRTRAQWIANPILVDARGAPQPVSIAPATIQANAFVLDFGGLSGDGGLSYGRGYDIVIDFDQDGRLSSGDHIDGMNDTGVWVLPDPTTAGPLAVTEVLYTGGTFLGQDLYYPNNIANMGQLPVVIVSHGNGHNYAWYDHIGYHLASWGFIVMSHQNDTMPGPETASTTTLTNTEYLLANQATIAGGALLGHIDSHKISFVGHSRGGEGVVRAYNRVKTGHFVPTQFVLSDVKFVSSIAPISFLTSAAATPTGVNYQLIYGASDSDVTGSPGASDSKPFCFYERSTGNKQVIYIQGAGHGNFHNNGGNCWCTGPSLIPATEQRKILIGYLLALVQHHIKGHAGAREFLVRSYESFRPLSVASNIIVAKEWRNSDTLPAFVIDDFQTQTSLATSSSGGAVSSDLANMSEGRMDDRDGSFAFSAGVPHNGMTNSSDTGDQPRCVVFDWSGGDRFYELAVLPAQQDFRDDVWLSFRAAQGTRHIETDTLNAALTFSVTLRDNAGTTSTIPLSSFGAVTRTYPRTGSGAGAGWANEWCTFRLRISDFRRNGVFIDLANITAVRFDFGPSYGSARGRIGLDDIEVVKQ
jgi:dienelactone hydrolase